MNEMIDLQAEATQMPPVKDDGQLLGDDGKQEAENAEAEAEGSTDESSVSEATAESAEAEQTDDADVTSPAENADAQACGEGAVSENEAAAHAAPKSERIANTVTSEAELLAEIERLKTELARRDAETERFMSERAEFLELYPDADFKDLPDSVWKDVGRGVPLAAAFALFERKRFCTEQKALAYNQLNTQRSTGGLEATPSDYYSPNEVRAMTPMEVRANYDKIMRSMQKWK